MRSTKTVERILTRARPSRQPSSARPPAVLLGGKETALPVVRSLGRAKVRLQALGDSGDLVSYSRHCDAFAATGHEAARWREWLASQDGGRGQVLLACSDEAVEFTARHSDALRADGYRLDTFDPDVALAMLDKDETYRRAAAGGFALPRWQTLRAGARAAQQVTELPLPCAVKPVHRHRFQARTGRHEKLFVVASKDELEATVHELLARDLDVMVTEVVPGPDTSLWSYHTYVGDDGECVGGVTVRKLRQEPIHFGVASLAVTEWNAEVADVARALVRHLRIRGPVEVELKQDATTGELKLIECNHRLNFLLELVHRAGYDLALLAYARAAGLPDPPRGRVRWGVRVWHPVMDFRALRGYRREGELTSWEWLRSIVHRDVCSTVWDRGDKAPGLVAAARVLRAVNRRRGRAAGSRPHSAVQASETSRPERSSIS